MLLSSLFLQLCTVNSKVLFEPQNRAGLVTKIQYYFRGVFGSPVRASVIMRSVSRENYIQSEQFVNGRSHQIVTKMAPHGVE